MHKKRIQRYFRKIFGATQTVMKKDISLDHVYSVFKWGIFMAFAFLFVFNHNFYVITASKIDRELIGPYKRSHTPLESLVEVTKPLVPTVITEQFDLDPTPTTKTVATGTAKKQVTTGTTISEDELWTALTSYRKQHGKKEISRSDKLCQYARKRAQELHVRLKNNPEDPLDAHTGFKRDADSGSVFEETGFNSVGENLAYTPSFTTGTQVIEWGWDTSSGHRTLQLSDDVTHACLSGVHPIYVGIFGS